MGLANAESVYDRVVRSLPLSDRLRLVELIVQELRLTDKTEAPREEYDWMAMRGIAPGLLRGDDAQHYVTESRQESDLRARAWDRER